MAITKNISVENINAVGEYKAVHVATDTIIKEDGVELSRSRHRHVLNCGTIDDSNNFVATNISSEDSAVQAVCNAVWTQAVKDAWKAKLIADKG
tara:strand:+ start:935 stop:1216 length:282 start_codon:yes stop_codon:yes gene_type:complete